MRHRRRRFGGSSLSEGISFEEVLTVITVLLLLRIVFMVPLVNLDKAKTVNAKTDLYWSRQAVHVLSHASAPEVIRPYRAAFNLQDAQASLTSTPEGIYIEAASSDSSLWIIRHTPRSQGFVAMRVQGQGHARSFRRGKLLWSQAEGEWFVGADTVDYGSDPSSRAMEASFRKWTLKERGY
jgi:hypothetical protein